MVLLCKKSKLDALNTTERISQNQEDSGKRKEDKEEERNILLEKKGERMKIKVNSYVYET